MNVKTDLSAYSPRYQPKTAAPKNPEKEWTVLFCMDGSNNLEAANVKQLLSLEKAGSSKDVNIVAQLTRGPRHSIYNKHSNAKTNLDGDWVGCRRYYVTKSSKDDGQIHSKTVMDFPGCPNHGDPRTWSDFISWGIQNYPAKNYMVVFSDHGAAFRGTGYDDLFQERLSMDELSVALDTVHKDTGVKPDIVTMDACLMASTELGFQLKDQVGYLVASEELVGEAGYPHVPVLNALKRKPDMAPKELASKLVRAAAKDTIKRLETDDYEAAEQLSAIDASKMGDVADAMKKLRVSLQRSNIDGKTLKDIILKTKHFGERRKPHADSRDLMHFCQNLQNDERVSPAVKKHAAAVEEACKKAIVDNQNEGEDMENAQGLSVYLPTKPHFLKKFDYHKIDFDQEVKWSAWLEKKLAS